MPSTARRPPRLSERLDDPTREERRMDEQTRQRRTLDALEIIAAELEKLRMLREHEMGVRVMDDQGSLYVALVED